jgi:hypothetical protein
MKKADWEILHKYRKSEHICVKCKYAHEKNEFLDFYNESYRCLKKQEAKLTSISTKASFCCDLWEEK